MKISLRQFIAPLMVLPVLTVAQAEEKMTPAVGTEPVSYYKQIRPIFQGNCHGCHQPAKAKGDYVMTTYEKLAKGGETGHAIVASKPEESFLLEQITLVDGKAEMPPKGAPLAAEDVALVKRWIAEGAIDDTPKNAVARYSPENPPIYVKAPVITSLDYSPDGKTIAVAGFHEVLLHKADGSGLVGRLVGLSERIESVRFSPDGEQLAVTGGLPSRMGELQIWDLATMKLELSLPVGHDTIYGASWSPDGKLVAFGMPDNTVRAVEAKTGKQVLFMGGHNDWVLDTVFSQKGDHVISVGRDMTAKLTRVDTERFIDNITSITPGALKGGIGAVALHPTQDHVLVGGSDGVPQIYRVIRETARKIGDNANLIRKFPGMEGRIWAVGFRPDGKRFAAGSSLNGKGQVNFYLSEYDATISPDLKKALETANRAPGKGPEDIVEEFTTRNAKQLASVGLNTAVYALSYSPDGKTVAVAGGDGIVRLIDSETAKVTKEFVPVTITNPQSVAQAQANADVFPKVDWEKETLPADMTAIEISPKEVKIDGAGRYQQLVVTAISAGGVRSDVTRLAAFDQDKPLVQLTPRGKAIPKAEGDGVLTVTLGKISATVPMKVSGLTAAAHSDWIRDVNPVISKMGCNAGTCHGSKDGKAGFKLSLRGYDPIYDVRAFTDDIVSRRVNYASPDDSLMLLKMTAGVPHEGKQLTRQFSTYYNVVRDWISDGGKLDLKAAKVTSIELFPKNPVIQNVGGRQQIRVVATYADGMQRDVTSEAFVESGNMDVAKHDDFALITTLRRGEAPVLARYEGAYAATTVTVMGKRDGFTWAEPEAYGDIDKLVAAKWQRMKIQPSGVCTDNEFIRRVYLDLTGLPPTSEAVRAFVADQTPQRVKREKLVDQLIGAPEFVDHWTNKWSDLLQVNSKFLGGEGAKIFRDWIKQEVAANTPYDQFVYKVLTASGSNKENPAASYYKILRDPDMIMENTTHLFLATRFNCNKCHDHPFERWTQDQYYETAAFFAQVGLARDGKNAAGANIGGSAVEGAKPLYEVISDLPKGEIKHDRTGVEQPPSFPYKATLAPVAFKTPEKPTRREEVAAWITSPDNQYFAMSYANRIWGYLLGTGVIEPLDDIRAGNPPSNPELLNYLSNQFVQSKFDVRKLMAMICKSRTYQLSIETNKWNEDDTVNFSHAKAKRLPAEVLFDAVYAVTGAVQNIPGAGKGVRASQLPDAQIDLKSGFLANLGRPVRESACECERNDDLQMSAVMAFLSGSAIADAVGDPNNSLAKLVSQQADDAKLIDEIYYRVLARGPQPAEVKAALDSMAQIEGDHAQLVAILAKKEAEWIPVKAEREVKRLQAVQKAQGDIVAYTPEFEKLKRDSEAAQKQRIAAADKALKDFEPQVPAKLSEWERGLPLTRTWTTWSPLKPATAVSQAKEITLTVENDGAVLASGTSRPTDYTLTLESKSKAITGLMIEALPNNSLAGFGPGLNPGGNFVVTEIDLEYAKAGTMDKLAKAKFTDIKVEHIQQGFDAKQAIDGNPANQQAWAVAGKERQPHWARLKLEKPIVTEAGAKLQLKISCRYASGEYALGYFRVWATESTDPLDLGVPSDVAAVLSVAPEIRTDAQKAALMTYFRARNVDLLTRQQTLLSEQRPLPADPKMEELKAALVKAELPIQQDNALVQLRQDVTYSVEQAANRRLTAAQDLTWALVNNPAFLFNH